MTHKRSITLRVLVIGLALTGAALCISRFSCTLRTDFASGRIYERGEDERPLPAARPSGRAGPLADNINRTGVQERLEADTEAGRPLVVHLIVALCDNRYQGIVPVPEHLGNGQDARSNLYWGAMYGVRTFLTRNAGWKVVRECSKLHHGVLEKIVLSSVVNRAGRQVEVYLVAEAWDGREIRTAVQKFLKMAAGQQSESLVIGSQEQSQMIQAGGSSHLVAYVGHNGLMDFSVGNQSDNSAPDLPRSATVLACKSKPYFQPHLKKAGAHPLLLTTSFMAPEAYTLDAAVRSWATGLAAHNVRDKAAAAYDKYQKCGLKAARNLFYFEPYPETK